MAAKKVKSVAEIMVQNRLSNHKFIISDIKVICERINMSKSYIKNKDGKIVAVRYTRADKRRSWDYEYDSSKLFINQGKCISINDHHEDGTTTSYEYKPGLVSELLYDGKGKKKS